MKPHQPQKPAASGDEALYVALLIFLVVAGVMVLSKKRRARKAKALQPSSVGKRIVEAPVAATVVKSKEKPKEIRKRKPLPEAPKPEPSPEPPAPPAPAPEKLEAQKLQSEEDRHRAKEAKERRQAELEKKNKEKKEKGEKEKRERERREKERKDEVGRRKAEEREKKEAEKKTKKEQAEKRKKAEEEKAKHASGVAAGVSGSILILAACIKRPLKVKTQKAARPPVVPSATANPLWKQQPTPTPPVPPSPKKPELQQQQQQQQQQHLVKPEASSPRSATATWRPTTDALPLCPLDRLCDCVNDPFHHHQFRHTCKIQNCDLADQEWHSRLFIHQEPTGRPQEGNIIVYNTENFSYVALQGNWAKVKIAKVKEKIAIHLNIPQDQQMLTTKGGGALNDPGQSCKEAGIANGKTLFVTRLPVGQDQANLLNMNVNARPFYPYVPQAPQPQLQPHYATPHAPIQPQFVPSAGAPVMATPIGTPVASLQQQQPQIQPIQQQHHMVHHMQHPYQDGKIVEKNKEAEKAEEGGGGIADSNGIVWSDEVPNESGYEDQLFHIGY